MQTLPHENDIQTEEPTAMIQDHKNRHCYISGNGQLVFDRHPSDEAHLLAKATRTEQPLYDCRTYLRDLIPKDWLGKHGTLRVSRMHTSQKTVVAITFVIDETPAPAPTP